jgi:hypothetical protein
VPLRALGFRALVRPDHYIYLTCVMWLGDGAGGWFVDVEYCLN